MENNLAEALKKFKKKYGESVVKVGVDALEVDGVLSLGSPSFDFCLYGGIPEGRIIELSGAEGGGKAQPLWSPVFTPTGYKKMGDINVGDNILDGKGNLTSVIGVFKRGVLPCYKVSFNDGTSTICADDHLWKVYDHAYGKKPQVKVLTTREIRQSELHKGCWRYSIDVPTLDTWQDHGIVVDPYLLGALIGDGSLHNNFSFSNNEQDVIDKVDSLLAMYGFKLRKSSYSEVDYDIVTTDRSVYWYKYNGETYKSLNTLKRCFNSEWSNVYKYINAVNKGNYTLAAKYEGYCKGLTIEKNPAWYSRNLLKEFFSDNNLYLKSVDKHIPKNYLYSSYETRINLLRGLYDTDGYTDKTGQMVYTTSSYQLYQDVAFLCRSLGFRVSVKHEAAPKYTYNGETRYGSPSWNMYIKTPSEITIGTSKKHTERLANNCNLPVTSRWWRSIVKVEYFSEEECQCILVDSPEHTYLTDDLICTHNTSSAFMIAASYQREEIKRNPDSPRSIILLDNEGTADPIWAKKFGYDMSETADVPTIIIRPEAQSAEEIFDMALDLLKTGEVGLLIFDSIATLVPMQISDESMEKQQIGGIAKALTRFANTAIGLLRKYKATLVAINQVRENVTGYGDPLTTPGGRAWKHACSVRLMFKRGDFFDADGNILTKKAESPAGHIVEVYVLKTKTCKWDRKLGYMHLNYVNGPDILQDTIDVALHFGLIDNSVQGSYKLIDPDTGEIICDTNGEPVKIRGKKNLTAYFKDRPEMWKKLYDMCYDKLKQKDDPYIVAFEQMMQVNINEKLGIDGDTNMEEI